MKFYIVIGTMLLLSTWGHAGLLDHKSILQSLDAAALERGKAIFQSSCAQCHGTDGNTPTLPTARSFGKDEFKFGSDPYSMWKTLSYGGGMMLPQTWLDASQRYDVIYYLREALVKPNNTGQYTTIDAQYLDALPDEKLRIIEAPDGSHPRDYGPVLSSQFKREFNTVMTVKLNPAVHMSYDLHRMAVVHAWDGFLDLRETQHILLRGERQPQPRGEPLQGQDTFYWAWEDALAEPEPQRGPKGIDGSRPDSPYPVDKLDYHGHYLYGDKVVFDYAIQGRNVLEMPGIIAGDPFQIIEHTLRVESGDQPLRLVLGHLQEDGWPTETIMQLTDNPAPTDQSARGTLAMMGVEGDDGNQGRFMATQAIGQVKDARWIMDDAHRLALEIPPSEKALFIKVFQYSGENSGVLEWVKAQARQHNEENPDVLDLAAVKEGGPPRWAEKISTAGYLKNTRPHYNPTTWPKKNKMVDPEPFPYTLDTVDLPENNPWNAWLRPSDLAFFPDGRLALCTYGGDVWVIDGLDNDLETVTWKRYAAGLFEPLGLFVVENKIMVTCRDAIIRLHDFNGDDEADYYEHFFTDPEVANGFHAYNFGLVQDSKGYFYYVKPGLYTDYTQPGAVIQVSPDGSRHKIIAKGFRVNNGLAIGEDDVLLVTDNQGQWTPGNEINVIEEGAFYGVYQRKPEKPGPFKRPMLYLPQEFDNSPGSPLWLNDERFGPLKGNILGTSFGKGWLYYMLPTNIQGEPHAAAVAFPFQGDAGIMRARTNPVDGQVYAVGLTGWDTEAVSKEGCLVRLRYTGDAGCVPTAYTVQSEKITLRFSSPLDPDYTTLRSHYKLSAWNYHWTAEYGSDPWSLKNPDKKGADPWQVQKVDMSEDGQELTLHVPDLQPVDQLRLVLELRTATGQNLEHVLYTTLNTMP